MAKKVKVHCFNWDKKGKHWWNSAIGSVYTKGKTKAIARKRAKRKIPRGAKITEYMGTVSRSGMVRRRKRRRR